MPLFQSMVGRSGGPAIETVEPRWLMNYAASMGDMMPVYYDTLASKPIPAHPAYVSHLEWDAISRLYDELPEINAADRLRSLHIFNDTTLHNPIQAGDRLSSEATVVGIESGRSGVRLTVRTDTQNQDASPVSTSYTSTVYRDSQFTGNAICPELPDPAPAEGWDDELTRTGHIDVSPIAAHVFSECARDYNPVHTDIAVATDAGLPGLILHGTGTIAMVLSDLVSHEAHADPSMVLRFRARLGAMVLCPSRVKLVVKPHLTDPLAFRLEALTDDGSPAIKDGFFALREEKK